MKFVGQIEEPVQYANGDIKVSFRVASAQRTEYYKVYNELVNALQDSNKGVTVSVDKYRKRRSLDANNYMWCLINKLCLSIKIPADELYRQFIRDLGIFRDVVLDKKAANTILTIWTAHGTGWFGEIVDYAEEGVKVRMYYGSSSYSTEQMSELINDVVNECKINSIETRTPEEINALLDKWVPHYGKE